MISLKRLLDELEAVLDPAEHGAIRRRHVGNALWEDGDTPPLIVRSPWDSAGEDVYPAREAVEDPGKMLFNELRRGFSSMFDWLQVRDDRPLQIRPDFGIALIASTFGAPVEVEDDNPPWVRRLPGDDVAAAIEQALDRLDVSTSHERGWLPRVGETLDFYAKTLEPYPNIRKSVAVAMPDLQGPFDTSDMLWGSELLIAFYTNPDLVSRLFQAVGDVMIHVHEHLRSWIGRELLPDGFSHQHGSIVRGSLLSRGDSNVLIGPDMFREQVLMYELRVLEAVGGGSFHSCGCWDQKAPLLIAAPEVGSVDFGSNQSQLNDMQMLYECAREHRKHLNLVTAAPEEVRSGSILERFPRGATFLTEMPDAGSAAELVAAWRCL